MMDIRGKWESRESLISMRVSRQLVVLLVVAAAMLSITLLLGLMVAGPRLARAAGPIYVDVDATGDNDGTTWEHAYTDLQEALTAAVSGDEIWVTEGVYKPGSSVNDTFQMKNGVAIYGGFTATETLRSQRDWEVNITVLSGDIDNNDITDANGVISDTDNIIGDNSYHVVTGSGTDETAILDGVTITGGNADFDDYNWGLDHSGGGIFNQAGSPTFQNVFVNGNYALAFGGGMYNRINSNPALVNVSFHNNYAGAGGGICNFDNSSPKVTDSYFKGNSVWEHGGGMCNQMNSSPLLTNTTFVENSANNRGGGMYNKEHSNPILINVTFKGNSATGEFGDGGGMFNVGSSPTLREVTFIANSAVVGGGMNNHGYSAYGWSVPQIISTTFSNNYASFRGGGMFNWAYSSPMMTSTTFVSNTASYGGGMYNSNYNAVFSNVSFIGNSADQDGGGLYNDHFESKDLTNIIFSGNFAGRNGGGIFIDTHSRPVLTNVTLSGNVAFNDGGGIYNLGSLYIKNSILWNNQDSSGTGTISATIDNAEGAGPFIGYSLVQASGGSGDYWENDIGYDGGHNLDADPKFMTPVDPTSAPTNAGDLHLRDVSPAIDAGADGLVSSAIDMDGNPRIMGCAVDLGPYEVQLMAVNCPNYIYLPVVSR